MSKYMNRYGFRAWPLYDYMNRGGGGGGGVEVFMVQPAHLHHNFLK